MSYVKKAQRILSWAVWFIGLLPKYSPPTPPVWFFFCLFKSFFVAICFFALVYVRVSVTHKSQKYYLEICYKNRTESSSLSTAPGTLCCCRRCSGRACSRRLCHWCCSYRFLLNPSVKIDVLEHEYDPKNNSCLDHELLLRVCGSGGEICENNASSRENKQAEADLPTSGL
jgi:hypothetical protein